MAPGGWGPYEDKREQTVYANADISAMVLVLTPTVKASL